MKEILITISFIKPNEKYLESYKEAYDEYIVNNIKSYGFTEPSLDIFDKFEKYRKGIDLKPGRVPSSYYWLVDEDSFIGEVSIRHYLTDELNNYGGILENKVVNQKDNMEIVTRRYWIDITN